MSQMGGPAPGEPVPDPGGGGDESDPLDGTTADGGAEVPDLGAPDAYATGPDSLDSDHGQSATTTADGLPGSTDGDPAADSDVLEAVELARRFEAERDEYLDHLRRLQAEFENFKRRVESQASEVRDRAAIDLVRELLPVLDTCDAAVAHGNEEIVPIRTQLLQTLEKQGLAPVAEEGVAFDPNIHEAVLHESGDGEAVVAEVMRTGYLWRDNVVRAAMVKVRG